MGDWSQLITALAALITAIGSAIAAIIVAIRSGNRQAVVASTNATRLADAATSDMPNNKIIEAVSTMDPDEVKKVFDVIQHMPGMVPPDGGDSR